MNLKLSSPYCLFERLPCIRWIIVDECQWMCKVGRWVACALNWTGLNSKHGRMWHRSLRCTVNLQQSSYPIHYSYENQINCPGPVQTYGDETKSYFTIRINKNHPRHHLYNLTFYSFATLSARSAAASRAILPSLPDR